MNTPRRIAVVVALALIQALVALPAVSVSVQLALSPRRLPGFATVPAAGVVDPELVGIISEIGPEGQVGAFVHFRDELPYEQGVAALEDTGMKVGHDFPQVNAAYAFGLAGELVVLSRAPQVVYLENAGTLALASETATWATRARTLNEQTGGLDLRVDENGDGNAADGYVDGSGVGIAIVDTGIDATHPDLSWCGAPGADQGTCKVKKNFKVECSTPGVSSTQTGLCFGPVLMQDVANSDTTSGHGTHVAAIAAGDGIAGGEGMFRGVAPRAKLYGFATGEGLFVIIPNAAVAFDWIYKHGLDQDPPIRVVNNSYGGAGAHNPNSILTKLSDKLIDIGITVVWAAGNSGGTGTNIQTSVNGNNPTPGNLSVAWYDDNDAGSRDNALSASSSRGMQSNPETWPDLSAPGELITSACAPATALCSTGLPITYPPFYTTFSGTSMAAPHTVGAVALLYQIDPTITPAEVENLLEDTAHKFQAGAAYDSCPPSSPPCDMSNPDDGSSFDKGHGLLDARLAVLRWLGLRDDYGARPNARGSTTTTIATGDGGDHPEPSVDILEVKIAEVGTNLEITWEVEDTSDPVGSTSYALFNSIDGTARRLQVTWDPITDVVRCSADVPAGCVASRNGDVFKASYPLSSLGVARGSIMFDAWAAAYLQVIQDRAPGDLGATFITFPLRGQEHVFVGSRRR